MPDPAIEFRDVSFRRGGGPLVLDHFTLTVETGEVLALVGRSGAGYLRELENGGTLVVTGRTYDAGAGMKFALASRRTGWWKGIGVRVDARAVVRQKGVTLDGRAHTSPAVGAALFVRF